jgi:hypothetical protein
MVQKHFSNEMKILSSLKIRIYPKWFPNASAVIWSLVLQTRKLANKTEQLWKCDDFSGEIIQLTDITRSSPCLSWADQCLNVGVYLMYKLSFETKPIENISLWTCWRYIIDNGSSVEVWHVFCHENRHWALQSKLLQNLLQMGNDKGIIQ